MQTNYNIDLENIARVLASKYGKTPKRTGGGYQTHCPLPKHEDNTGSLSLTLKDGKLLVYCHAGCNQETVFEEVNRLSDNGNNRRTNKQSKNEVVYPYRDRNDTTILEKVRIYPKSFYIRQPNGNGGYVKNAEGKHTVEGADTSIIYCLPDVLHAISNGQTVYVAEGEKDCDNLRALGLVATCNIFGASKDDKKTKWTDENAKWLKGAKEVISFADNDSPGKAHALAVAKTVHPLNIPCKVIELPNLPDKGDVSDWLAAGGTKEQLLELVEAAPFYDSEETKAIWTEPKPLPRRILPDVPVLPEALVPEPLRAGLRDIAWRMQVSLEPVVIATLVTISSLIGASCRVRPKQLDDWGVVVNLWGSVVDYPGTAKTGILNAASTKLLAPLISMARQLYKEGETEHDAHKAVWEAKKTAIKEQMKAAAKPNKQTGLTNESKLESLEQDYRNLVLAEPKPLKRHSTNSTTVQAIQMILADNPRGILVVADELIRLFESWDTPGHEADRKFFLEAWDGGTHFDHDTVSRGNTYVPCNTLSLLGNTTPDGLQKYLVSSNTGNDDGLVQRFQLSVFPSSGQWQWVDQKPDAVAAEQIHELIKRLDILDYSTIGAEFDAGGKFFYLRFSSEATAVFQEWLTELKSEIMPRESNPLIIGHLSKYPSLFASLALIFCIIRTVHNGLSLAVITEQDAEVAAAWCGYLELHARKIYALLDDAKMLAMYALDKKIQDGDVQDGFYARDIRRKGWQHLPAPLVEYACDALVELDRLKKETVESTKKGGRPTCRYWINPRLKTSPEDI